jgi:hypothetical protein
MESIRDWFQQPELQFDRGIADRHGFETMM